jgi:HSP20 family protein
MALLRRRWMDPWAHLSEVEGAMNQFMRNFFNGGLLGDLGNFLPALSTSSAATDWIPAIEMLSRGNDLVLRAELPGVDPENDVDIRVEDGVLTIRGERRQEERAEGDQYYRLETHYGAFQRSIPLPEGVNTDDIQATHNHGVLEVVVPGAGQVSSAKKIPIQVGKGGRKAITAEAITDEKSPKKK